jgi:hypothetical protein
MRQDIVALGTISSSRHVFPFTAVLRSSIKAMNRENATDRWNRTTSASELIFLSGTVKGASRSAWGKESALGVVMVFGGEIAGGVDDPNFVDLGGRKD